MPEALGVAEPPAEYADYPEASAALNQPLVSSHELSAAVAQAPVLIEEERNSQTHTNQTHAHPTLSKEGGRGGSKAFAASSIEDNAGVEDALVAEAVVTEEHAPLPAGCAVADASDNAWHVLLPQLKLSGMAQQLAEHCLLPAPLDEQTDGKINLLLDQSGETLRTTRTAEALTEALQAHTSSSAQVEFIVAEAIGETPEKRRIRLQKERQAAAEQSIADDPVVQQLRQKWGGVVIPGSVRPNKDVGAS